MANKLPLLCLHTTHPQAWYLPVIPGLARGSRLVTVFMGHWTTLDVNKVPNVLWVYTLFNRSVTNMLILWRERSPVLATCGE